MIDLFFTVTLIVWSMNADCLFFFLGGVMVYHKNNSFFVFYYLLLLGGRNCRKLNLV